MVDPEERLKTYRAKRDFAVTAEPAGGPVEGDGRRFVVQRHRARRLHYDFRLEVGGVLASWAVPKGPTLDPKGRQLAVHVEDHPIEYFDFEGVIPKGEYGGGDVIVWDWGTWEPAGTDDPLAAIEKGELHFDIQGDKLAGRFALIRRDKDRSAKEQWLLIHKNDDHAQPGWDPEEHPRSVKTGRTNDEVAAAPDVLVAQRPAGGRGRCPPRRRPPAPADLGSPDRRRAGRPRRAGQGRDLGAPGPGAEAHQPRQGPVPGPRGRGRGRAPVTKRDLIRYHAQVAPFMLPYTYDRPINLNRFPDGVDRPGFWHKEVPGHAPDWMTRWHNDEADPGETEWYFVVDSVPALAWMANYGALELHAWTSRLPDVHQPTWALIDIDPGPNVTFDDVVVLARLYRTALEHLRSWACPR